MNLSGFERDGYAIVHGLVERGVCEGLCETLPESPRGGMRRITERSTEARSVAECDSVRGAVEELLGSEAHLTRAILFDKRPGANWAVGPHRDETIAVKGQNDTPGFGPWSVKDGVVHVRPPRAILDRMLTLRLHLDPADESNGALRVWPGSHSTNDLQAPDDASVLCTVQAGDAVLMRPTMVHASGKATNPTRRRVLHLEFAAGPLPNGLEWAEA